MSIPMNGESYVLSLEVIMDDDENQTQFGNLDMGNVDEKELAEAIDGLEEFPLSENQQRLV